MMTKNSIRISYAIMFFSIALVAGIGFLDHSTGELYDLSILYVLPVMLTVWFTDRIKAIIVSVTTIAVWEYEDIIFKNFSDSIREVSANAVIRLIFFVFVVYLIALVKREFELQKKYATTDALTGAFNRRSFFEILEREVSRAKRAGSKITVIYMDIDNFKKVNDEMGHHKGDDLLREVVSLLSLHLRSEDILARLGGDEFAMLLPGDDLKGGAAFVKKASEILEPLKAGFPKVSFSFGAVTSSGGTEALEMLKKADNIMYEVKQSGKNSYRHEELS